MQMCIIPTYVPSDQDEQFTAQLMTHQDDFQSSNLTDPQVRNYSHHIVIFFHSFGWRPLVYNMKASTTFNAAQLLEHMPRWQSSSAHRSPRDTAAVHVAILVLPEFTPANRRVPGINRMLLIYIYICICIEICIFIFM